MPDSVARGPANMALVFAPPDAHLVVVHDRVHALDPQGVNRSVEHDPLVGFGDGETDTHGEVSRLSRLHATPVGWPDEVYSRKHNNIIDLKATI